MYESSVSSTSNGTLFFSFHRSIGIASSDERGNSSKCCTKTRITGSGTINAASSSFNCSVFITEATAVFTAIGFAMFVSIAEGTSAPGGRASTANPSTPPVRVNRAPDTCSGVNSIAAVGCGVASSHPMNRRTASILYSPPWYAPALLNERHLVNFPQRRHTALHLGQPALAKRNHTLFDSSSLDFRRRPPAHDHFPDVIRQIQQFADRRTSVISRPRAFQAPSALRKNKINCLRGIDSRFPQLFRSMLLWPFPVLANQPHQPLRHDALQ